MYMRTTMSCTTYDLCFSFAFLFLVTTVGFDIDIFFR